MSQVEQPDDTTSPAEPTITEPNHVKRGSPVAGIALVVALAAAGLSGWNAWQWQQVSHVATTPQPLVPSEPLVSPEQLEQLAAKQSALDEKWQALEQQWQVRDTEFAMLKDAQQRSQDLLSSVQLNARQDLRLAEAEHLLRLASLRLSALGDINSAVALIRGADDVLREQDDPRAFALRKVLAQSAEALASVPLPDRTGLFLTLGALREQVQNLTETAPRFVAEPVETTGTQVDQWLSKLTQYVRIDLNTQEEIRPLLAGQHLAQARLALELAIQQAQWAVLNGDKDIYQNALKQAQDIFRTQFSKTAQQTHALEKRLQDLAEQPVSVEAPDLLPALDALRTYMKARSRSVSASDTDVAEESQP